MGEDLSRSFIECFQQPDILYHFQTSELTDPFASCIIFSLPFEERIIQLYGTIAQCVYLR